jgi:hypothetical protein
LVLVVKSRVFPPGSRESRGQLVIGDIGSDNFRVPQFSDKGVVRIQIAPKQSAEFREGDCHFVSSRCEREKQERLSLTNRDLADGPQSTAS